MPGSPAEVKTPEDSRKKAGSKDGVEVEISGTENATSWFSAAFSPDGERLAFEKEGKLRKVSVKEGRVEVLCDVQEFGGATWGPDGTISVSCILRDNQGVEVARVTGIEIDPLQQLVGFVTEGRFFKEYLDSLNGPFTGTVELGVTRGPEIVALALIQKKETFGSALLSVPTVPFQPSH